MTATMITDTGKATREVAVLNDEALTKYLRVTETAEVIEYGLVRVTKAKTLFAGDEHTPRHIHETVVLTPMDIQAIVNLTPYDIEGNHR